LATAIEHGWNGSASKLDPNQFSRVPISGEERNWGFRDHTVVIQSYDGEEIVAVVLWEVAAS
jgi:hypothetical protein